MRLHGRKHNKKQNIENREFCILNSRYRGNRAGHEKNQLNWKMCVHFANAKHPFYEMLDLISL